MPPRSKEPLTARKASPVQSALPETFDSQFLENEGKKNLDWIPTASWGWNLGMSAGWRSKPSPYVRHSLIRLLSEDGNKLWEESEFSGGPSMQHLRGEAVEESQPGYAELIGKDRRQSKRGNAMMKLAHTLLVMGLLLCVAGTMAQDTENLEPEQFQVMISKTTVTLMCPVSTYSIKHNTEVKTENGEYAIPEYKSSQHDGKYTCETAQRVIITLYLKAKVCESCVELDPLTVAGIIIADLLITLGVLVLAYYFSKNRKGRGGSGGGGRAGGHPRGQKMVRPPPVPNPDYEPIRKGQREVYAGLDSRGF